MSSSITISRQQVSTHIGITEEERRLPQVLEVTATFTPLVSFEELGDDLENTVDYSQVYLQILEISCAKSRDLVETLAVDLVNGIWAQFPLQSIEVRIDKFILPNVERVSITHSRTR